MWSSNYCYKILRKDREKKRLRKYGWTNVFGCLTGGRVGQRWQKWKFLSVFSFSFSLGTYVGDRVSWSSGWLSLVCRITYNNFAFLICLPWECQNYSELSCLLDFLSNQGMSNLWVTPSTAGTYLRDSTLNLQVFFLGCVLCQEGHVWCQYKFTEK